MKTQYSIDFDKIWKVTFLSFFLFIFFSIPHVQAQNKQDPKKTKQNKTENKNISPNNTASVPTSKYAGLLLKEVDLERMLKDVSNDTVLQIERLSAFYFHQLLNEYRLKNKQGWLNWDDRLWLAARNHNLYLEADCDGHYEKETRAFYTAVEFPDRVNYVLTEGYISSCGENVFCGARALGQTIEEISFDMAEDALALWKISPGHNMNMLRSENRSEGTSFYIDKNHTFTATTVFASSVSSKAHEIQIDWNAALAQKNTPSLVMKENVLQSSIPNDVLNEKVFDIVKAKIPSGVSARDNIVERATKKHVLYLKTNHSKALIENSKDSNYYEATSVTRYAKASGQKPKKVEKTFRVSEKCFVITIPLTEFVDKNQYSFIEKKISLSIPPNCIIYQWGATVDFFEKDGQYCCIMDVMWVEKLP